MKQLSISAAILTISLCANAQSPGLPKDVKNMLDSLKQSQQAPQNSTGSAQQASGAKAVDINPADLTRKILRVAAVPSTVEYTGNDWSILKEQFPLQTFSNGTDKTYTDVKTTTIKTKSAEITITAKGARSMILGVDAEAFNKNGDYFGFSDYLKKSNVFRKVCSLDESASFSDIYYEYSENVKPILIHYQFSSGSGGGTEIMQVGNQTLPKECKKTIQNAVTDKPQSSTSSALDQDIDSFIKTCSQRGKKYPPKFSGSYRGVLISEFIPESASGEGDYWGYVFDTPAEKLKIAIPEASKSAKIKMSKAQAAEFKFIERTIRDQGGKSWLVCGGPWKRGGND